MTYQPVNQPNGRPYQERYKRDAHGFLDSMYSAGPYIVGIFNFIVALGCLVALGIFDLVIGRYTAGYIASEGWLAWFTSAAETGLIIGIFGTAIYGWRHGWPTFVVVIVVIVGLIPASIDVYFDGMSVDILRFGHFIIPSEQFADSPAQIMPYNLYRVMFGSLSAVGEPLTASSVIVFPVIRELLRKVLSS
jgi:hypothetical protein